MPHRKGSLFLTDPFFSLVKVMAGARDHEAHNRAVMEVLTAIYTRVSQRVNYHHVNCTIPRMDIPLRYKNQIYDIAYLDRDGNRILVEIKVVRPRKIKQS